MKKINLSVAAVLMAGAVLSSSCVGSFSLLNKYAKWQQNMTSNKWVNGIVGFILVGPVGGICFTVDTVVLNTIEFWSGSNPLAHNGTTTIQGQDGRYYAVKSLNDGYEITAPDGLVTRFIHDEATDAWSMQQNGQTREVFRFNQDGTIQASLTDGTTMDVTRDEAGLNKIREAVTGEQNFFAFNF